MVIVKSLASYFVAFLWLGICLPNHMFPSLDWHNRQWNLIFFLSKYVGASQMVKNSPNCEDLPNYISTNLMRFGWISLCFVCLDHPMHHFRAQHLAYPHILMCHKGFSSNSNHLIIIINITITIRSWTKSFTSDHLYAQHHKSSFISTGGSALVFCFCVLIVEPCDISNQIFIPNCAERIYDIMNHGPVEFW